MTSCASAAAAIFIDCHTPFQGVSMMATSAKDADKFKCWKDFSGKPVFFTTAGFMNWLNMQRSFKALGYDFKHVQIDTKSNADALQAGTIVGSGTVSNREDGGPGRPAPLGGVGYSCIAEQRTVETLAGGKPCTPFMRFGDRVRIEMLDAAGQSVFGAIDQVVRPRR